jgi:hypothetical protein
MDVGGPSGRVVLVSQGIRVGGWLAHFRFHACHAGSLPQTSCGAAARLPR